MDMETCPSGECDVLIHTRADFIECQFLESCMNDGVFVPYRSQYELTSSRLGFSVFEE